MKKLLLFPASMPDENKMEEAYEVAEDTAYAHEGIIITVPKFFQFDGASIPAPLWPIIGSPFHPRFMCAAVMHDWLYHSHQVDRRATDDIFFELLLKNGVSESKAYIMWESVRKFGEFYWDNRDEDVAYLDRLATRIIQDGRNPADYGLIPENYKPPRVPYLGELPLFDQ